MTLNNMTAYENNVKRQVLFCGVLVCEQYCNVFIVSF